MFLVVIALIILGFACGVKSNKTDSSALKIGQCEFAVVGAGAGGVYAAWRLAKDGAVSPGSICVFERLSHVGGRTYTLHNQGPRRDLQVDLGATVFCDRLPRAADECNGMETPLMKQVIQRALGLTTGPYRDNPPANDTNYKGCSKIILANTTRENAGFATYIERMADEAIGLGVNMMFNYHLDEIRAPTPSLLASGASSSMELRFSNGRTFNATSVLLNLPVLPLNQVIRASPSLQPHLEKTLFSGAFLRVPHGFRLFKLLLHYDWAWWRTLGLLDGSFYAGECQRSYSGAPLETCDQNLPLAGRYHDAHVICDDGNDTGHRCRGFLQAVYTSDGSNVNSVSAWELWGLGTSPPHQRLTNASGGDSAWLLYTLHKSLVNAHRSLLDQAGLTRTVIGELPTEALLILWDPKTTGFGAATHGMTPGLISGGCGSNQGPCHLQSSQLGFETVTQLAAHPFRSTGLRLSIANEAFHPSDWGEGSLQMAENVLRREFGILKPEWIEPAFYKAVLFPDQQNEITV